MTDEQALGVAVKVIKQFIKELGYEDALFCIMSDKYQITVAGVEKGFLITEGDL